MDTLPHRLRYVSCSQAAQLLFSTEGAIRQQIRRGRLQAVRDGRAVRIPIDEVQRALREKF